MLIIYDEKPENPDQFWLTEFFKAIETSFAIIQIVVELPSSKELVIQKCVEKGYSYTINQRSGKFFITIEGPNG